jgi:phosphopantothenate---cysteine ligase (CTP)
MNAIVTCGPSYEPIDDVRRMTNFSTGELGVRLANELTEAGVETICLRGEQATWPGECRAAETIPFSTNDDLLAKLWACGEAGTVDAVFHAAALCDYRVSGIQDATGEAVAGAKMPTGGGELRMTLTPTSKVIAELRSIFPNGVLVGWKYELEGDRSDVLKKAFVQIESNGTAACVVNGAAYGRDFGLCEPPDSVTGFSDKGELCAGLVAWLFERRSGAV